MGLSSCIVDVFVRFNGLEDLGVEDRSFRNVKLFVESVRRSEGDLRLLGERDLVPDWRDGREGLPGGEGVFPKYP